MTARRASFILFIVLLSVSSLFAQTSGGVAGHVTDSSGAILPGVTVEARSSSLQGVRTATSDSEGGYRITLLPPGAYMLTFTLDGFVPLQHKNVVIGLGKDTTVDASLNPGTSQEITVTAEAPVLDTASSSVETNFSARAIETLPTGRNYSSIVQVAPGTSSDANPSNPEQSTISVYGSSGAENSFLIDGVNTTNMEYGFQGKDLNFEFIQEVDVKTGGYEAEFGRSTGGIINVITKSGGNAYRGDVFGYYDSDSLQANAKEIVSTSGTIKGFTRKDIGADLGGFAMRDRLWFFAAYDSVDHTVDSALPAGPQAGEVVASKSSRDLGSAKLTYAVTTNQSLVATFFQDPRVDTGAINDANHSLNGDPLTYQGRQDFGGRDYGLRYDGVLAAQWIVSGQAARHEEQNSVGPESSAGDVIQYVDIANDGFRSGGFGLVQEKNFTRNFVGTSATWLPRNHEIKAGLEYEEDKADVIKRMSGGQQVEVYANLVNPDKPIYKHNYWSTPDATVENAPTSQLTASPQHKVTTLYVQDRWAIRDNLNVNYGVRWDRQEIFDAEGTKQIDLKKDYAPRLGFTWDPSADHRSKVYGSYGKYFEEIPMDLVIRSFSFERQPRIINYSPTSTTPDSAAEADFGTSSGILGGFTEPSDPNIRNQYMTEYVIGGEREVVSDVAIGVKGIYRSYGNVIEDFLCAGDGTYCIGNPGRGIFQRVFTLDYSQQFDAPKPVRIYRGMELTANKRFSHNWQAMASYIYSKLEGNYDGEYSPFTNIGADPNISAAYDYYDFFTDGRDLTRITNRGDLSNDRRNQFKASGMYVTPWKLQLGASAYWRSGTPLSRYGYSDAYSRYEFFLTDRGTEGRTPSNYEADVHLGYPIKASKLTVNVMLDVFNILNAQRAVLLDQRWGFQESDNALPTPSNPDYGKPVLRTPPTSVRLGVRLSF